MASAEIVPFKQYAVTQMDASDVLDVIRENLGDEAAQFDRVSMPGGGGQSWEVPNVEGGVESVPAIYGVMLHMQTTRRFFTQSFEETGGDTPPDCSSPDGKIGYGNPGDDLREQGKGCAECPFSRYGSGKGQGQACGQRKELYVLTPGDFLPIVVDLSAGSLKDATNYIMRLTRGGKPFHKVVTKIGLRAETGGPTGKIKYSVATFEQAGALDAEDHERVKGLAEALRPVINARIDRARQSRVVEPDEDPDENPMD